MRDVNRNLTAVGTHGSSTRAPAGAAMKQLLDLAGQRLEAAERLLARPDMRRAAELVGHLEEGCRALAAVENLMRAEGASLRPAQEIIAASEALASSARRLARLTEGARRFCEGWAAVIGIQAGYTALGKRDAAPSGGYRLDSRG